MGSMSSVALPHHVSISSPKVSWRGASFAHGMHSPTLHAVPASHALPLRSEGRDAEYCALSPSASPPVTGDQFGIEETAEGDVLAAVMVAVASGTSRRPLRPPHDQRCLGRKDQIGRQWHLSLIHI